LFLDCDFSVLKFVNTIFFFLFLFPPCSAPSRKHALANPALIDAAALQDKLAEIGGPDKGNVGPELGDAPAEVDPIAGGDDDGSGVPKTVETAAAEAKAGAAAASADTSAGTLSSASGASLNPAPSNPKPKA
jgi:hypothetical protein